MRKALKVTLLAAGILLILLAGIILALQFTLSRKLAPLIRSRVIPAAEAKLKVKLHVGEAGVNLFRGSVRVGDVRVGNPAGFREPSLFSLRRMLLDVGIAKLLRREIEVSRIEIRDADLTIVRNKAGAINLDELIKNLGGGPGEAGPAAAAKPKAEGPAALPRAMLKTFDLTTLIRYVDHSLARETPLEIPLRLSVNVRNLSTYASGVNGALSITGALAGNRDYCRTDIKGTIAPLLDPMKATFDLAGDVGSVDVEMLKPYLDAAGITCRSLALKLKLVCRDGVFDASQSVMTLQMEQVSMTGGPVGAAPRTSTQLSKVVVPVPVEGTLAAPKVGLSRAISRALADNLKNNAGDVLKGVLQDQIRKKSGINIRLPF